MPSLWSESWSTCLTPSCRRRLRRRCSTPRSRKVFLFVPESIMVHFRQVWRKGNQCQFCVLSRSRPLTFQATIVVPSRPFGYWAALFLFLFFYLYPFLNKIRFIKTLT